MYFQKLQGQAEAYYESVSLSIWSITEISIGIVVANLPPLRKSFDGMFKHILPDSVTDKVFSGKPSQGQGQSYNLPTYRSQVTRRSTIEAMTGRSARQTKDNESDKAILEDLEGEYTGKKFSKRGIMRTTRVSVDHVTGNEK